MKYKIFVIIIAITFSGFAFRYAGNNRSEKEITYEFSSLLARKASLRDSIVFKQYRAFVSKSGNNFYPGFEDFKPVLNKPLVRAQDEYDKLYISYLKYRLQALNNKLKENYKEEFKHIYKSDNYVDIEHSDLLDKEGIRSNVIIIDYMDSIVNVERYIKTISLRNKSLIQAYKKMQKNE